jgi:colicin import membrane protein
MEEKNTVPAAIPPAGTEDIPTRKDRRPIIIAVAAVAATVLAVGGVCGYRVYENHRVSLARQACASAVADQSKAVKSYKALLGADGTTAALKTDATSVKDAKTLDALKQAVGAETPGMVRCDASDKTGLDEAAAKADKTTKGVKADAKTLESAVRAVESSKLDKTVADADGLYKATDGKVQDEKTREALRQAIAKRDADAIAKAVKAVNDSKAAKDRADAEAAAKAQAEQEAAAQQAQQQAQAQRSYSYGSYSSGGWSGSAGGQSYSGGSYSGGSQGGSSSNAGSSSSSASDDIHYDWEDNTGDQYNCQPDKFCPLG